MNWIIKKPAAPGHVEPKPPPFGFLKPHIRFGCLEKSRFAAMPRPLAFAAVVALILTVLHASPEIPGVALSFDQPEPLDVDGFSRSLSQGIEDMEELLEEKIGRTASVEIPASWNCQEQRDLREAGSTVNIAVDSVSRILPDIAYSIAGIAAGNDNLLQENVIYLRIWEDRMRAYTGRFVDGDFEVNETFETLQLHFHQTLQELARPSLPPQEELWDNQVLHLLNLAELKEAYCDAFQKGSTDFHFDYRVRFRLEDKTSVRVTFDTQVLDQKVNELQNNMTHFIDTIVGRPVKLQDVTLVIDEVSSFCLPDRRLFRDFFPQQVVELHRPSGLKGGRYAFETQRRQWFLGKEQVQVESHDSPDLGLVICKVREEVGLREELETLRLEKMQELDSKLGKLRDQKERLEEEEREVQTIQTSLLQVLEDDFPLAHPRYNSCWLLEKPTTDDCRHDSNESGGRLTSVLKFTRIYKEILWHSRRSQGSQMLPRSLQCQGLSHSMVLLEADNLVKPQGMTLVETLLEFIRTSQSECGVHMEQPASTEPRYYARVWVRAEDENLLRDCIKSLASQKMKKSNVKKLKLIHRTEVNNDYGDSPRTFDSDVM